MIELVSFWDARVMANHTAWQIGRIASVRGHEDQQDSTVLHGVEFKETYHNSITNITVPAFSGLYKSAVEKLDVNDQIKTYGDVTALYFMSTTGIGAFGETSKKADADTLRKIFAEQGQGMIEWLKVHIKEIVHKAIEQITMKIPDIPLISDWLKALAQWVQDLVDKVLEAIFKPIIDIIGKLLDKIISAITDCDTDVYTDATWDRFASRLGAAAVRMKRAEYKLEYSLPDFNTQAGRASKRLWSSQFGRKKGNAFFYPQTALNTDPRDQGWLKKPNVWPPNGQKQSIVEIKLEWPFSGMWLFPVISGMGGKGDIVVARGNSLHYIQPAIYTEHLLSKGSSAYETGPRDTRADISGLDIGNYVKMMSFSMNYRMRAESLRAGDRERHGVIWRWGYMYDPLWDIQADQCTKHADWRRTCKTLMNSRGDEYSKSSPAKKYGDTGNAGDFGPYKKSDIDRKFWAYREYLYWPTDKTLRPRYRGPNKCKDHLLCREGNKDGGKDWGHEGKSDMMFFSHSESLKKQKTDPDAQTDAQLMKCARAYDRQQSTHCAIANAGQMIAVSSTTTNVPLQQLFSKCFRRDLRTAFLVSLDAGDANGFITTNLTMKTHAATNKVYSLLGLQTREFNLAMWELKADLEKVASGETGEIEDDLVDQAGIDLYNGDPEATIRDVKKWWDEMRVKIEKRYEDITTGISTLAAECSSYELAAQNFSNRLEQIHFPMLEKDIQKAFNEIELWETPPSDEAGVIAAVRAKLKGTANAKSFLGDYDSFRNAYEQFRKDIWIQCDNEVNWANSVGARSQHGKKELTPEDLFPEDDDPDSPENVPGGDPSVSGNDKFEFGDRWKRGDRGWEKY